MQFGRVVPPLRDVYDAAAVSSRAKGSRDDCISGSVRGRSNYRLDAKSPMSMNNTLMKDIGRASI